VYAKSEFFRSVLPAEAIDALLDHFTHARVAGESRELDFSPWGGAYNRVAADATAFPHRAERFLLKHEVVVAGDELAAPARAWLARSWELVHPAGAGGVYANFPDADLGPWDRAHHRDNLDRLVEVAAHYGASRDRDP
jgi:hypothetical protein